MIAGSANRDVMHLVLRYLVVGGFTFSTYFALLYLLVSWLGVSYPLAVTVCYVCALLVHFLANRSFTFRVHGADFGGQLARYAATALLNYVLQIAVIFGLHQVIDCNLYLAALIAIILNLIVGFAMQQKWVFVVVDDTRPRN